MKSYLVDLTLQRHHETDGAILVSNDGDRKKAVWLPRSCIEILVKDASKGIVVVTMAERLAIDKGLA